MKGKKKVIGKAMKGKGKAAHTHKVVAKGKFAKEEAKEMSKTKRTSY
jgi:hypothetical protein